MRAYDLLWSMMKERRMGLLAREYVVESAMSDKMGVAEVSTSAVFVNQFVSQCNPRAFPPALNYDCGEPDYPDLFADWEAREKSVCTADSPEATAGLKERWRRATGAAPLLPGGCAKMLATRPDMQIAGDWMRVPAARNWRRWRAALRSCFLICKRKVDPGETLREKMQKP